MAAQKKTAEVDYSMQEKILALYELQKIDSKIDEINKIKGELPLEVQDLEDELVVDGRLALVNANLPLTAEPTPELAVADDATGQQLEAEAAQQYRTMAEAARNSGIALTLETGYQDTAARQAAFDAAKQAYLEKGRSEEEASAKAALTVPMPDYSPCR